ncbi:TadE/TadG family type IV pilus assembly protein [Novosphingobium ginsenosidimutans]|nr:TadE/TadG family type IV pilus assembly protein [Novosphingobium ginsenosidimutans]
MNIITALLRDQRGGGAAEFALVLPLFVLLVFGTINGSIMYSAQNQMHYAAQRAARCKAVDVTSACPDADAYAKTMYNGPSLAGLTFTATDDATCGWRITGSGQYELMSGFTSTTINIRADSCYPKI